MRAYVVAEPNGEFREIELSRPVSGMNQVLVRIAASGINPLGTKISAIRYLFMSTLPLALLRFPAPANHRCVRGNSGR